MENVLLRESFGTYQSARGLSERTVTCRTRMLTAWERSLAGRGLLEATPGDVDLFCPTSHMATRAWYLSNLHAFYRWAVREGFTDRDPTQRIERPRLPRRKPRPATKQQIRSAFETAGRRLRAMIALGALAGLRCVEIGRVHSEDLDFDSGRLFVEGKGGHQRVVPIPTELEKALRNYGVGEGWMFPSRLRPDEHLQAHTVSRMGADHFVALSLPTRMHSLRHFYGSELGRRGVHIEVIQELMGHANIATTRGYVLVDPSALRVARGLSFGEGL